MDFSSVIFITGILLLVALFVGWPLSSSRHVPAGRFDAQRSGLLAERDRILEAIADLDSDQLIGKLDPDNYQAQRDRLVAQGAEVLRRLEPETAGDSPSPKSSPASDDPVEALIAARRQAREKPESSFCGSCGKPVYPTDKFCANCGAAT